MTEPLRVGLIGLGNVALAHLEGYRQLDQITVVAGADPRSDRAAEMAARYGFTPYGSYRDMVAKERLDLVCVLSTVASHREAVEVAADKGLHILCEKPLAITLEDADAMIARCRERGVKLFYAASYRYLPAVQTARRMIAEGAIGEVRLFLETMIGTTGPAGYMDMGPHHYPAGGPGGSGNGLVDHGIHLVDVFPWIAGGRVISVTGRGQLSGKAPIAEYLAMELDSGALGQLIYDDATWSAELPQEGLFSWGPSWDQMSRGEAGNRPAGWLPNPGQIKVFGSAGSFRIYHYANHLMLWTARGVEQIRLEDRTMPAQFAAEMASFVESIRKDTAPEVTGEDGRRALAVVLGAYQSMATGQRVRFD